MPVAGNNTVLTEFKLSNVEITILSVLNILFSVFGCCGNMFICFLFFAFSRLRSTINVYILSLAFSDLLVNLIAQPMFVASLIKNYQQKHMDNAFEAIRKCLTWIALLATVGNLLGVTIDRFVAITNPFKYGSRFGGIKQKTGLFLAIIWIISGGLGTGTAFEPNLKIVGLVYVFVVVICFILPFYGRMWYISHNHQQSILAQRVYTTVITVTTPNPIRRRRKSEELYGAVKTIGLISALFIVGWFPLLIAPVLYRIKFIQRQLVLSLFQWVNTLALCSAAINPIVYSWTDRRFRESLWLIYNRWSSKRQIRIEQQ